MAPPPLHRRALLAATLAAPLASALGQGIGQGPAGGTRMHTRPIPSTKEALPVIGLGTWQGFDQAPGSPGHAELPAVVDALLAAGGRVIDSSPMYGRAEAVAGEILAAEGRRARAFVATKVWIEGRAEGERQMQQSMRLLGADPIELMQVHNLLDWRTQLATLRRWKDQGRVRHLGITHYTASAYPQVEAVLRAERLDTLQINYAFDDRAAEERLLPLAADRGVAVIVNMPFGGGGLLRGLLNHPLPAWAAEIGCTSWAQVLLKFVLSHPAVTCAIPGTRRPGHMADNARAGFGPQPDRAFWRDKVLPG